MIAIVRLTTYVRTHNNECEGSVYVRMYVRPGCCLRNWQSGCLMPVCPQCFTCRASRLPLACLPAVLHVQSKPAASCLLAFSASRAEQAGCLLPVCPQCFTCRASRLPLACLPSVLHVQSKPAASCLSAHSASRAEQASCLLPVCPQCFTCRASRLPLACLPSVLAAYFCVLSMTPACLGGVEWHADS